MQLPDNVKMFLFARWISTCYADEHLDQEKRPSTLPGFNTSQAISVLNREDGYWWKEQLEFFNNTVWPKYLSNGTVEDTVNFLNNKQK
jgi:hypothetical protein